MTNAYLPVQRQEPHSGEFRSLHLGKIHSPSHPLFEGVSDLRVRYIPSFFSPFRILAHALSPSCSIFRCGFNFVWNCKANDESKVLAEWSDGNPLACERECGRGRILFLNVYPVSTRVVIVGLDKECDGRILLKTERNRRRRSERKEKRREERKKKSKKARNGRRILPQSLPCVYPCGRPWLREAYPLA